MEDFGLTSNSVNKINSVFQQYPEIIEVLIFGSRAKGNFRDNSDIDLAIKSKNISLSVLQQIEIKLEELFIPNYFDLVIYEKIENQELIEHINRVGKNFYMK